MKYVIDHDYHIHSLLSACSRDPEENAARILAYGKLNGFRSLCLTDHYWDERVPGASAWYAPQDTAHIREALPLPQDEGLRFYFGCETDQREDLTLGISRERIEELDFVVIPTTHLHMNGFTVRGNETEEERARLWVKRLDALLDRELPFHKIGIAHLACQLIAADRHPANVLRLIPAEEKKRLFTKAALRGAGIELNGGDFDRRAHSPQDIDETVALFAVAKEYGCRFYLGSDAHHPKDLDRAPETFAFAVDSLGLTEEDKFRPLG